MPVTPKEKSQHDKVVYTTNTRKNEVGNLQLFNQCPITNEIRNLPKEIIVTYPPKMCFPKVNQYAKKCQNSNVTTIKEHK